MRLLRGSGPARPCRDGARDAAGRPRYSCARCSTFPKARLVATLRKAKIPFADDPSNRDPRFTRVRLRKLMPALGGEGLDARRLALLARRLRRAEAALEAAVERLPRLRRGAGSRAGIEMAAGISPACRRRWRCGCWAAPSTAAGNEGPVELGQARGAARRHVAKRPANGRVSPHFGRGDGYTRRRKGLTVEAGAGPA